MITIADVLVLVISVFTSYSAQSWGSLLAAYLSVVAIIEFCIEFWR